MLGLLVQPFQRQFLASVFDDPSILISILSGPRGIGKTSLIGRMAAQALLPGSPLYSPGREVVCIAGNIVQARLTIEAALQILPADIRTNRKQWMFEDNSQRIMATRKECRSRMRVMSSSAKGALGLGGRQTLIVFDEPASSDEREGAAMYAALAGALGKTDTRLMLIGTLAPASINGWWPRLVKSGSYEHRHVTLMSATDKEPWDDLRLAYRLNPLTKVNPLLRSVIKSERNDARKSQESEQRYRADRLNQHVLLADTSLLSVSDWDAVLARPVPPREGKCHVGLDIGSSRSWSAAWFLWPNGRTECIANVPGIPNLHEQERHNALPRGTLQRLVNDGALVVDEGKRLAQVSTLVNAMREYPIMGITCDRFHVNALRDEVGGRWPIQTRVCQWSEYSEDIAAFRRDVVDGDLSVDPRCRALATLGVSQAEVEHDRSGNCRLVKTNQRRRDDIAVAAVLASGKRARQGGSRRIRVASTAA